MTTTVPCPACRAPLPGPVSSCPACGLPLTGPLTAEIWQVQHQLQAVQARHAALVAALRRSAPVAPAPVPFAPVSSAPAPAAPTPPARLPGAAGVGRWPTQQVLLGVGALLVLTAAVVFLAVTWSALGVSGQVAVMAAVTLLAGTAGAVLARRRLRASAEALAGLSLALALVDAAAAHQLDLAGLAAVDPVGYAGVVAAGLALVSAALSAPGLRLGLLSYRYAAGVLAALAPVLLVVGSDASEIAATSTFAVAAGLFGLGGRRLPAAWSGLRRPAVLAAAVPLGLVWLVAPGVTADPAALTGPQWACAGIALLTAAVAGAVAGLHRGPAAAFYGHPLLAAGALAAVAVQLTVLAERGGVVVLAAVAVLAVAAPAALAYASARWRDSPAGSAVLLSLLLGAGGLLVLTAQADVSSTTPGWAALTVALAATAAAAAAVAYRRRPLVLVAAVVAGVTLAAAGAVAAAPTGPDGTAYALTAAAVLVAGVAGWHRGTDLERALVPVAAGAALAASALAVAAGPRPLAAVLAAVGLAGFAYGVLPGRGWAALVGVAGCSGATWTLLADADVRTVEAYTLPLAGLVALVGLVRWRRDPASPSWLTAGPALTTALLPSALATLDDPALLRPLLVVGCAVAVLVVGVLARWQAPVLVGGAAAAVVAVGQLAPYAVGLPRWLTFGTLGVLLLVLGSRYEARRRNASQALRWLSALH